MTLMAWAFLRLAQDPSGRRALVAGTVAGITCLTRLTALIPVVCGLAWMVVEAPPERRRKMTLAAGVSLLTAGLLVAPFLISCAREWGDPFYAVNYYTKYYRFVEGLSPSVNESALHFMGRNLVGRPFQTIDTVSGGLFSWPFVEKWQGFQRWSEPLTLLLKGSAACGLVLLFWSATGRILLVLVISSLIPYCLTWVLGGGGAWRFHEHTYPVYLIAAFHFLQQAVRAAAAFVRRPSLTMPDLTARTVLRGAALVTAGVLIWIAYLVLPFFVQRETLARGEPITIDARTRHRWFLIGAWSEAHTTGNVTIRAAREPHVGMRALLPRRMDYQLTLRLDPISAIDAPELKKVALFVNGQALQNLDLTYDAARVGTYRLRIPEQMTRNGLNRIDLLASRTVAAASAGTEFAWLDRREPVAFRFWYFRLEPLSGPVPVPQEP
jgi:hypothetical protein